MTGERYEFETTKGLLSDVMRKQAGSLEKAVLEGVMNAVDANAENITIDVGVNEIAISDDGDGMSENDIGVYFKKFGYKDDDVSDKEFGKFRMGRGQMFSYGTNVWHTQDNIILVSIEEDEIDCSEYDIVETNETVDVEGQSFIVLDSSVYVDGTNIHIDLYEDVMNPSEKCGDIKDLIEYIPYVFDVDIQINNSYEDERYTTVSSSVVTEPDHEDALAYYWFYPNDWSSQTSVYNQGAYVCDEKLSNTSGIIVTKQELDVNFARNDILGGYIWDDLVDRYEDALVDYLSDKSGLDTSQRRWLLDKAEDDEKAMMKIYDSPIVEDIEGEMWSIKELSERSVAFSDSGDELAKSVMDTTDAVVVKSIMEPELTKVGEGIETSDLGEFVDENMAFEMTEVDIDKLDTDELERFRVLMWIAEEVEPEYDVKAGFSNRKHFWLDGNEQLFINKSILEDDWSTILTSHALTMVETLAYQEDTRGGADKDFSYRRTFEKYIGRFKEEQSYYVEEYLG